MAKSKGGQTSHDDLAEMPSGLIHTSDSNRNPPRGEFYDRFGPPGDPTQTPKLSGDKARGKPPTLLKKFQNNKGQK